MQFCHFENKKYKEKPVLGLHVVFWSKVYRIGTDVLLAEFGWKKLRFIFTTLNMLVCRSQGEQGCVYLGGEEGSSRK